MPCRDPEPTPDQEHTRLTFELLEFVPGMTPEQHNALGMTAEEETNVCDQLAEILSDPAGFDDDVL